MPTGQFKLPERISRLEELAHNLWWSWDDRARELFQALDYPLWHLTGHNPVKMLHQISQKKLASIAYNPAFLN